MIRASIGLSRTSIINRWAGGKKFKVAAERFFNNPKVSLLSLKEEIFARCENTDMKGEVLVLQDTVELNYNSHNGRLKVNDPDIGLISDNKSTGFLVHPGLAIESKSGIPLGICGVEMWQRGFGSPSSKERNYKQQPIEEKESYKWIRVAEQSKAIYSQAKLTIIGDRENDIYEYFCRIPDERTDLLVRSSWDRKLNNGLLLTQHMETIEWEGKVALEIRGSAKRTKRKAELQLRWTKIQIAKSPNRKKILRDYPDSCSLYVVELKEKQGSVPLGEEPVYWRLLTTHKIESRADSLKIAKWYSSRWWIEDLFRVLKTQGLEVERSQLSTGIALKKLVLLCLEQALKIVLLRQERNGIKGFKAIICFSFEEQLYLKMLELQIEGNTEKQKNPHQKNSLAWAVWIIAQLGGWTPADLSKRPPGVITISRGLKNFNQQYIGWKTAVIYFPEISKNNP